MEVSKTSKHVRLQNIIGEARVTQKLQVILQSLPSINFSRFTQAFRQSTFSLSFNLGAILAGVLLAAYFGSFSLAPWGLAIYPGILSMRGVIGGLFSGRLSTGLHIGTIRIGFTKNTRNFYMLWRATIVLTLESSIMLGAIATIFGVVFWGVDIGESFTILGVVISTMALSLILISPITVLVSTLSFQRGLDPDVTVYPIIATIADVVVTICYILMLEVFFKWDYVGRYLIGSFSLFFFCLALYILQNDLDEEGFVKTIKESFFTIILVAFIVNITGSFLTRITSIVGSRPGIYLIYPALIDTIGSVGSIVGSTATTKLVLGTLKPSFSSIKKHTYEIGAAWVASLVMFILYAIISHTMFLTSLAEFTRLLVVLLITNVLAVLSMVEIAFAVGVLTYRRGWDPDNFVIPIESSLADTITTVALLLALTLIILQ
ncbi:MAG: magnesium transporter [Candidatus Bathyarchaeota archaeon]|nr:MAG: magnesium transporter [Candidatus Bathyarchaeota archaeon]